MNLFARMLNRFRRLRLRLAGAVTTQPIALGRGRRTNDHGLRFADDMDVAFLSLEHHIMILVHADAQVLIELLGDECRSVRDDHFFTVHYDIVRLLD